MTTFTSEAVTATVPHTLPAGLTLGAPQLAVADLGRSLAFYGELLGLRPIEAGAGHALLGSGDTPVIELVAQPGATRQPARATGLYHVAILLPSRRDLARTIMRLLQAGYRIGGASDHGVSEAFYLDDPDGNGLELYRDRPRAEWPMRGREVAMDTLPIDVEEFFSVLRGDQEPWSGIAPGTTVGHLHLRVGDVAAAARFYRDVVGFEVMQSLPGAAFVSVNGYHHHLGLNEWQSRGASPPPANAAGLRHARILLPAAADLAVLLGRLDAADVPSEAREGSVVFADPWGNRWVAEA